MSHSVMRVLILANTILIGLFAHTVSVLETKREERSHQCHLSTMYSCSRLSEPLLTTREARNGGYRPCCYWNWTRSCTRGDSGQGTNLHGLHVLPLVALCVVRLFRRGYITGPRHPVRVIPSGSVGDTQRDEHTCVSIFILLQYDRFIAVQHTSHSAGPAQPTHLAPHCQSPPGSEQHGTGVLACWAIG